MNNLKRTIRHTAYLVMSFAYPIYNDSNTVDDLPLIIALTIDIVGLLLLVLLAAAALVWLKVL